MAVDNKCKRGSRERERATKTQRHNLRAKLTWAELSWAELIWAESRWRRDIEGGLRNKQLVLSGKFLAVLRERDSHEFAQEKLFPRHNAFMNETVLLWLNGVAWVAAAACLSATTSTDSGHNSWKRISSFAGICYGINHSQGAMTHMRPAACLCRKLTFTFRLNSDIRDAFFHGTHQLWKFMPCWFMQRQWKLPKVKR